jgi:uncharacterized membrane-anchored protein
VITKVLGSRHHMVRVPGYEWKRHVDQLLKDNTQIKPENECDEAEISAEKSTIPVADELPENPDRSENTSDEITDSDSHNPSVTNDNCSTIPDDPRSDDTEPGGRRYPLRANRGRLDK